MLLWGAEFVGLETRTMKNRGLSHRNVLGVQMPGQLLVVLNLSFSQREPPGDSVVEATGNSCPGALSITSSLPEHCGGAKHGFFSSQP